MGVNYMSNIIRDRHKQHKINILTFKWIHKKNALMSLQTAMFASTECKLES